MAEQNEGLNVANQKQGLKVVKNKKVGSCFTETRFERSKKKNKVKKR